MKFAHITDCHIGAWRNPKLRDLNLKAFEEAIMNCIDAAVDFIVISGDFFDANIPQLGPVKKAVQLIKACQIPRNSNLYDLRFTRFCHDQRIDD